TCVIVNNCVTSGNRGVGPRYVVSIKLHRVRSSVIDGGLASQCGTTSGVAGTRDLVSKNIVKIVVPVLVWRVGTGQQHYPNGISVPVNFLIESSLDRVSIYLASHLNHPSSSGSSGTSGSDAPVSSITRAESASARTKPRRARIFNSTWSVSH